MKVCGSEKAFSCSKGMVYLMTAFVRSRMFVPIPPVMEKRIADGAYTGAKALMQGYIIGNNGSLKENVKHGNMRSF